MSDGTNSRQHDRLPVQGTSIRIRFKTAKDFQECYLRDISRGGIFVNARNIQPVGSTIVVVLTLPEGDEVRLLGRVVHVRSPAHATPALPSGMGIEFLDLSPELIQMLDRYVHRLKKGPPALPAADRPPAPAQTVQPQSVPRSPARVANPAAVGDEIELLRRLCWILCRGALSERPLQEVLGIPGGVPEAVRLEMFARLRQALGLEHPPVFLGPSDAFEVKRRLDVIEVLAKSGD